MLSCLVLTLLFPQGSLILFQPLHSENIAGANEQQSTAVQAAVVTLREHPKIWHGVSESLWIHPYCHSPEEAHQGTALPQPQEHPWAAGCPHPTRGSSGDMLAYRSPPPALTYAMGLSFSFAFPFSPHFPGLWGPFQPPFTASSLWYGGCWLWEVSSRWFSSWLVNFPQQREQEPNFPRAALRTQR